MLTIKPIGSSQDEVGYYAHLGEAENHSYYSEDGNRPGRWWGEGAAALGLSGEVDPLEFQNLLEGLSPDGKKELVQRRNGDKLKRRAGFDLTWSVPKSFSTAWSQASTEKRAELDRLAEKALYRAMDVVQDLCGVTRRGKDGHVTEQAKLVAAVFNHDTARGVPGHTPDANKHFHAVVANVVVREDGTGALDARPLFQGRMKMALGAMFRAELSMLLERELGVVTCRPKREHREELASWFEIEGVPPELMKAMSKRRVEIEKWLRQHGLSGAKASEKAALRTREGKERFTWEELTTAWQKLGKEYGFGREEVEALFGRLKEVEVDRKSESEQAVHRALDGLIEQKSRFTENELLERTAIEAQARGVGIDDVLGVVKRAVEQNSEIVRLQDAKGVRAFTTKEMLRVEKQMLETSIALHNRTKHAVAIESVNEAIQKHNTLRPDQANAVRAIATGGDMVAITGVAGSGKTFMLTVARQVLESAGYTLLGTSLASKASKGLEKESGIRSLHIHKLFHELDQGKLQIGSNTILVVDEAGMVGTVHMERLTRLAKNSRAKLVLVGDHKQLQAIAAGAPLRAIGVEIGTTEMTTIVRQREPWAREMVLDFRDGKAEQALAKLYDQGQLLIAEDREEAVERLVLDWEALVFGQGQNVKETLVFAGMNADVRELNRRLQEVMSRNGQLGDYSVEVDGLAFHLGDEVMVTKNHNRLNLRNGTLAEVVGVQENRMWILTEDGFEMEIDTEEFSDLTLGYAMSVHKGQGVTCQNALILTGNTMTDRESAYVAGSRPREKTFFYADALSVGGIEELAVRMNTSRQKEMAHEYLLEVQ